MEYYSALGMCLVAQSCQTLCDPMDSSPPGSSVQEFSRQKYWSGIAKPSSRGSSQPRDWTQVSRIAGGSFTIWATRKPKSAGVGSLSLLPGIFLTQEVNWGLLHCRWILYQLSYHLVIHKKEQNCVICKDVDRLRDCHTEWSKSEREKHTY